MNQRLYHLNHSTWICDYHIVWCPKYRGNVLEDKYIKNQLKTMFKNIVKWKGLIIHAWHIGDNHIHLYISIPPKYSTAYTIQILKGKTSAWIKKKTKKFPRGTLWQRGYFVSTIGLNKHQIKNYINDQSHHQIELTQKKLF
ncbi:IS200/IS605 family transposase [Candidatus Campbellbacteria bacterium]|nr:MAG: IS200/IS605 family transposase [Candidatus Campbellbacteria bacterium]